MRLTKPGSRIRRRIAAFTLVEVVVSLAITTSVFGGIILAYIQTSRRAEWTGYSLAAQGLAIQQLEQARSAIYDPSITPVKNELTNLNLNAWSYSSGVLKGYSTAILDLPVTGTNVVWATNYVTVRMIWASTNPPVSIQMVQVDTVWPFTGWGTRRLFTNSVANYYAPDNPEAL